MDSCMDNVNAYFCIFSVEYHERNDDRLLDNETIKHEYNQFKWQLFEIRDDCIGNIFLRNITSMCIVTNKKDKLRLIPNKVAKLANIHGCLSDGCYLGLMITVDHNIDLNNIYLRQYQPSAYELGIFLKHMIVIKNIHYVSVD